ncbi:MAG: M23 family metallopeptidase [Patescibacteria group bacterium]|nr:M23 family metallopeptidase [Patescibacteria group bacterium]
MRTLQLYYSLHPWTVAQKFGLNGEFYRKNGINIKGHNGIDAVRGGGHEIHAANVRAAHDGVVTYVGVDNKEGYGVVIRTKKQFLDVNGQPHFWKTIYWHLLPNIPVKVGQEVKIGDILGEADNTGFSFGSHLHFGLKPIYQGENDWTWFNLDQSNGYFGAVDPEPYFTGLTAYDLTTKFRDIAKILKEIFNLIMSFKKIVSKRS